MIRSLGRAGLDVHTAWCPLNSASLESRYIKTIHSIPYYRPDEVTWIDAFNELVCRFDFDLVVPCDDASLLPLQMHKGQLARPGSIYLLSDEAHWMTSDKQRTYEVAQELGIPLPRQLVVATPAELAAAVHEFGLPILAKPPRSAESRDPQARRSVKRVRRPEDLELIASAIPQETFLVQEFFRGIGVGVETLCRNGEVLVAFQHERVHEPLLGGGSTYRRSVPLNPELLEATCKLMKAVSYTGVCMVEFRYNPESRRWVLIETNGRFWGSLPLAIASGVDFPRYLYEMMKYGKTEFDGAYRLNLYCRNWRMDLGWLRSNLRADKADPTLMSLPLHRVMAEVRNVFLLRERSDTFTLDDPGPAMEELAGLFGRLSATVSSRLTVVRRRMRHRALNLFRHSSSVLFVCKGNICRSPFAEYYAKARMPTLRISSVGLLPASGRSSPKFAVEAARARGIDLSQHRSKVLTDEHLRSFDVIFVFDADLFRAVDRAAKRQSMAGKVFYLGSLDVREALEIRDPYGKNLVDFEAAYARIASLIDRTAAAAGRAAAHTETAA
ncbi:MAG: ATP-grasp domain-containing protein [Acidobacteriaceae bacterium]|nr:ATP-grasp domain-containing protein [Acidobacteriaceae bacterium]